MVTLKYVSYRFPRKGQTSFTRFFCQSKALCVAKKSKALQQVTAAACGLSSKTSFIPPTPQQQQQTHDHVIANEIEADIPSLTLPDWDRGGRKTKETLTPLYASMRKVIDANPGSVCLIQVGSFYELYFEQATVFGPKLNLKVATRRTSSYAVPMAGFPVFQLQKFVKTLVQDLEVNVAIVDQYPHIDRSASDSIIHRKISRIISPGTLVDETFLNYNQNNYLAAVHLPANCTKSPADPDTPVGLSWIDISVGEFYVQQTTLGEVMTDVSRISPSEIILSKDFQLDCLTNGKWYPALQDLKKYFVRYHKTTYKDLKLQFKSGIQATRKALEAFTPREEAAMNMILSYINVNLPESNPSLDVPTQYWNAKCLQMDSRTREALELTERQTSGTSSVVGSLFTTIKRTVTPSGTRLLTQWIKSPILDVDELRYRQAFVHLFKDNDYIKLHIRHQLSKLGDFVRSIQYLSFGTGNTVSQLQEIAEGLVKVKEIEDYLTQEMSSGLKSTALKTFMRDFKVPIDIASQIQSTLHIEYEKTNSELEKFDEEQPDQVVDPEEPEPNAIETTSFQRTMSGSYSNDSIQRYKLNPQTSTNEAQRPFLFAIKRDHNTELLRLHDEFDALKLREHHMLSQLETLLHDDIDPKLTVTKKAQHGRYTNVIHIAGRKASIDRVHMALEKDTRDKRKGSILYTSPDWSRLQASIGDKMDEINIIEREIILSLRNLVLDSVINIRKISRMVDFLDISSSFAMLATEYQLTCPRFVKAPQLKITGGRHIVVEASLKNAGHMFTPNDTNLGSDGNLWVISGPNMGGKSTYLRQNALIVILAQIGSFVPAEKASMGIVDKIFTRIGASDDLYSDLSTFMVEMVETSNILKNATPRSLAIVDEVGRGTSGKEGLAIAYSTLIHLLQVNRCRSLFATHFGRELEGLLTDAGMSQDKVRYFRTRVLKNHQKKDAKDLDYFIDHRLEPGISERSYAFEVAKLAGFPNSALDHAVHALKLLNV